MTKAFLHGPGAKVRARLPGFHTCVGSGGDRQTSEWYKEKGITVATNVQLNSVDDKAKTVVLASAGTQSGETESVSYENLFLALGMSAWNPQPD